MQLKNIQARVIVLMHSRLFQHAFEYKYHSNISDGNLVIEQR